MVASERERHGVTPVAQRDEARLPAVKALLDDDPRDGLPRHAGLSGRVQLCRHRQALDGLLGLRHGVAYGDALAGRQAVRLDHDAAPVTGQLASERGGGRGIVEAGCTRHPDTRRPGDVMAEGLARLDPRGGLRRPEDREAGVA